MTIVDNRLDPGCLIKKRALTLKTSVTLTAPSESVHRSLQNHGLTKALYIAAKLKQKHNLL